MDNAGGMKAYPTRAGDYKFLEECGHGVSAIVYRALCVPLNEIVAIKVLDLEKCSSNLDEIRREATTMSLINHPNVVRAYCSFVVNQNLWVVMPFLSGGSCLHVMKAAFPEGFEELVIATILKETLKALEYLHRHGHIHRDVKAGNILIDSNGAVKLADFGVSACMFDTGDRQKSRQTFVGTPCWMAPEVMEQIHGYDFKADIWSFGITALELAHGHAPFSKYPPMKVLLMTLQHEPPGLNLDRDKRFTKSFKEMIASCLVKDPSKRPPVEKLLKHPFFKQAKSADYLVRHVLQGLPPLGERVKALKIKDQARMAAKMMPLGEQEEVSHNEYKRGVSSWNFSIEDLKQQAKDEEEDGGSSQAPSSDEGSFGRGAGGGGMVSSKGGTSAGGGSSRGTRGSHSDAESDPSPSMEGSPRQAQHRTHAMMSSTVHPAPLSTASAAAASALDGDKGEKGLMAGAMDSRDGGGAGAAAPAGGGGGYAGAGPMRGRTSRGPTPPPMQNVQMLIIGGESQNGHKFLSGNGGGGGGLFSPKTGEVQQQHQSMYGGSGGGGGGGSSTTGVIVVRKEGVVKHVGRFDVEIAERTSPPQQQHQPGGAAGAQRSIVMERLEAVTVTSAVPIGGEVGERSSRHSSGLERVAIENRTALEQREREHRGSLGNLSFFDKDRDRPLANGVPSSSAAGAGGAPRGAAASAGATPSKDAEQSQVVRKGRFSVTPGNVEDVESTLPIPPKRPNAGAAVKAAQQAPQSSQVHRSPSINDWSAQSGGGADRRSSLNPSSSPSPPIVNHPAATTASAGGGGGLLVPVVNVLPHLQNMMHHVICEQDLLLNLMNCLSANDPSALCRSKVSSMGSRESAEHGGDVTDRERDLLRQVMELQSRVAALTEQLELVKGKNVQLERKLNTIFNEEEERRIHAEERDRSPDND